MKLPHGWLRAQAVFDDENLVSCAGLVPVMALAEQTGLSELVSGRVAIKVTSVKSAGVNPAGKVTSIVAEQDCDVIRVTQRVRVGERIAVEPASAEIVLPR